jgi:hypothetical protein
MQQQLQEGAWTEQQQAAPQQLDMAASGAASRAAALLSGTNHVNQQLLLQQLLQQQELAAGMAYGGSSGIAQQGQTLQPGQEQFGGAVMVDRLLPRLQR